MTTAWEILVENSTLESGTAWEHINAQGAGGSGTIIVTGSIEANSIMDIQDINLIVDDISFNLQFMTSTEVLGAINLSADTIIEVR